MKALRLSGIIFECYRGHRHSSCVQTIWCELRCPDCYAPISSFTGIWSDANCEIINSTDSLKSLMTEEQWNEFCKEVR